MIEPVSFAMIAAQLRLGSDTSEQLLIESYIAAAREWVEDHTGHIVAQRSVTDYFDGFDDRLRLTKRPIAEITSISFANSAGEPLTYADFEARTNGILPALYPSLSGWPLDYRRGSIAVEYVAGYDQIDVPARFVQAILLLASEYYRHRSAGAVSVEAQRAVENLLQAFRVPVL